MILTAVVHPIGHPVGNPQQNALSPPGPTGGNGQILNPAQGQSTEPFYGTATSPQDLNQPPANVDALTATLGETNSATNFPLRVNDINIPYFLIAKQAADRAHPCPRSTCTIKMALRWRR